MGELGTALNSLSLNIEDIQNILKEDLSQQDKKTFERLLDNSRVSFTKFSEFAKNEIEELNKSGLSASASATALEQLQSIISEIAAEKQMTIENINLLNSTKMKEVQFNSYFAQVNYYNVMIMKILVLSSILMMINIFLYTRKYSSEKIYVIISIIIISVTLIVLTKMIYSEYQRTNYSFNTFHWFKPQ